MIEGQALFLGLLAIINIMAGYKYENEDSIVFFGLSESYANEQMEKIIR